MEMTLGEKEENNYHSYTQNDWVGRKRMNKIKEKQITTDQLNMM